jgi:hypothetical protein
MRRVMLVAAGCVLLAGCGADTAEWTEEVRLSDGQMVVVWRKDRRASSGFPNSHRGRLIDFELKYTPMSVHWKDAVTPTHVRFLMSFDIIDGVPHLVLEGNSEVCIGRPATDYAAEFLKWIDGRWVTVPQAEFPVDRTLINLFGDQWGHRKHGDVRGLITWLEKAERDRFNADRPDTVKAYFERGSRICANRPHREIRTSW